MKKQSVTRGILKYRVDATPVLLVIGASALALVPFLGPLPSWALLGLWLLVFYSRTFAAFAQHNHAHLPVFNWKLLNWLYDVLLTQNTGYPTALWELHHNRGHHRHFLDPDRDVAAIVYPGTTRVMSRSMYALRGNLRIHRDAIRIGREEARSGRKSLLPKLLAESMVQTLLTGLLLAWNWQIAIAFVVVPNFLSAWLIWWQSYPHHHQMPCTTIYDGSMTVERATYNRVTFNIGHHTAHHEKPTLHWSLLPARTARIRARIHPDCLRDGHQTVGNGLGKGVSRWLHAALAAGRRGSRKGHSARSA